MLEKQVNVEKIEVMTDGSVYVTKKTQVFENKTLIAESSIVKVINPGQDYSQEAEQVQTICAATHTPETIAAYKASNNVNESQ